MGNPTKKEDLGSYMTGGHGALPYFNTFMNVYMKDKPKETFPEPPPIPSEIKALSEQRKREEQEKLEKAALEGEKLGSIVNYSSSSNRPARRTSRAATSSSSTTGDDVPTTIDPTDTPTIAPPPPLPSKPSEDASKPPVKPVTANTPVKKAEAPPEKPAAEAPKRKGKKGDGDN
jgi:membrane peptidoglycan carboxypeptidase